MSNNLDMKERLNELLGPEFWEEFGRRLGKAIKDSPYKPADIAKHLECSPAHISKAISTGSISLQALTAIAIHLKVSLDELVFGNRSLIPAAGGAFTDQVREWLAKAPPQLMPEVATLQEPPPTKTYPEASPEAAEIGETETKGAASGARAGRKVYGIVEGAPDRRNYTPVRKAK